MIELLVGFALGALSVTLLVRSINKHMTRERERHRQAHRDLIASLPPPRRERP